jgi:hypothetical protein
VATTLYFGAAALIVTCELSDFALSKVRNSVTLFVTREEFQQTTKSAINPIEEERKNSNAGQTFR